LSLCELLPYKTICKDYETNFTGILGQVDTNFGIVGIKGTNTSIVGYIPYCKPYLFPLSSMTKEQKIECQLIKHLCSDDNSFVLFDWYNKNHFDYRGLIEIGLAIEAPEGMYN
jgi:hypothetical protein